MKMTVVLAAALCAEAAWARERTDLFNGRDLSGWTAVADQDAYDPAKPLSGITKAPRQGADVEKPFGEWNVLEVELKGDTLVNRLNDVELNRVTGLSVTKGAIALQSEGGAAEFRNMWFEEVPVEPVVIKDIEVVD